MVHSEIHQKLTKEQKEAVGLLSIGTFLEYFDLMLYVHMAVLLNDLFFPKYSPHTMQLLAAIAFCSTYLLRPVGALAFGWIGDNLGRKFTVIITTSMMAISCIVMASLPTFAEIGIAASWLVSICRIVQGMTSMGEITGAQLYLTESLKPPGRYVGVATMNLSVALGTACALCVAFFVTSYGLNWRLAFWLGAGIASVGIVARTALRETPDFVNAKLRLRNALEKLKDDEGNINPEEILEENQIHIDNDKVSFKTTMSLLLLDCMWPVMFYYVYIHCANILKYSFKYSAEQIIQNNFLVSGVAVLNILLVVYLSNKIYPLKILRIKLVLSAITLLLVPFWLYRATTGFDILIAQSLLLFFACDASPANGVFFKYFPVFKRFTFASVIYAISRVLVYVVTSFSLVYLTDYFGHFGVYCITIPAIIGFAYGLNHFIKLEKEAQNYHEKKTYIESFVEANN
jgi:MHS family proline/betaine transporter-like MFS transporter